jgi:hypothetical protein
MKTAQTASRALSGIRCCSWRSGSHQPPAHGAATDLNDIPMAVSNQVKGNFLVVLDNSQSMDAFMGGALQSGNNPNTRGNIGRDILRGMLGNYRTSFNWGLMSFATAAPSLRDTYVYLMGDDNGMVLTDDCVAGISASNGNRRCVANPQPFAGGRFVTYDVSSDDPWILDVLYNTFANQTPQLWAYSDPRNKIPPPTQYIITATQRHALGRRGRGCLFEYLGKSHPIHRNGCRIPALLPGSDPTTLSPPRLGIQLKHHRWRTPGRTR